MPVATPRTACVRDKTAEQAVAPLSAVVARSTTGGSFAAGLPLFLQPKLAISEPNDPAEQEADRVADQVMRMPDLMVQRQCVACAAGGPPCSACEEEASVQVARKADGATDGEAPASVGSVLHSPGQPLALSTRAFFEPRFGKELSQVRVHTDGAAQQSARDVSALAYTVGTHVVFDAGRYAPGTPDGQRLLAHELTHVLQQGGSDEIHAGETPGLFPLAPIVSPAIQRDVRPTEGGEGGMFDQPWQQQVQEARSIATTTGSYDREIELINIALGPVYGAYPELVFPVLPFRLASVRPGGVYFDPENREPGTTFWAQDPPERRALIRTERLFEPDPPPRLVSGSAIFNVDTDPGLVYAFIKLGPLALSEGTRAWTRSILYHEYQHFQNNMASVRGGWRGISTRAGMSPEEQASEHALIHARTFRTFFPYLEWRGTSTGRGDPLWREVHDPVLASQQPAAEALNDLGVIQRYYFPGASASGRDRVVGEILGVIEDNPEAATRLRAILEELPPDLASVTPDGRFKRRLQDALAP